MQDVNQREMWIGHHPSLEDKHPRLTTNVLIVDDDVEWAIAVSTAFLKLGCHVDCALEAGEARRRICAGKADIIVLDWMLDRDVCAGEVMFLATQKIAKFGARPDFHKPKIITLSSKSGFEIELPPSPYYEHMDHWSKPLKYPDLARKALGLVNQLG